MSLQREIQAANEHETGLGIFTTTMLALSSLVCFSPWNICFCTTVCLHKKNHTLQPTAEYHIKIIQQKVLLFSGCRNIEKIHKSLCYSYICDFGQQNFTSETFEQKHTIANPTILGCSEYMKYITINRYHNSRTIFKQKVSADRDDNVRIP